MRLILIVCILSVCSSAVAQFAPQAGVSGSTAISANDSRFVAWANTCTIQRGWQDIADKAKGVPTIGNDADGIGKQDGSIVSLGDSGIAVLTFTGVIYNGQGPDFAVFENGFANPINPEEAFLEFAFVEVSSDGVNYVRFPATCNIDTPQIPGSGVYSVARKVNNLAGKYITGYGTPFDLEELNGSPNLNVDSITHVRLVDVIGSLGSNGTLDDSGKKINDPYPTPFISSGFDLDAVGALNFKGWWPQSVSNLSKRQVSVYPNPATDVLTIQVGKVLNNSIVTITDVTGRVLLKNDLFQQVQKMNISNLQTGVYFINLSTDNKTVWTERFAKY